MSQSITAKRMTTALHTADPSLTVDLTDVYDPRNPAIHQGCAGRITDPSTQSYLDLNAAWRPRDEHRMAVLAPGFDDPNLTGHNVMVPNTAKFIAEYAAQLFQIYRQPDDHNTIESTE